MEKYVINIKELVIQVLTNGSEIKAKAESGNAMACFQMGLIHLLGIKTPIDFKKASSYLGNQSLNDDRNATLLLGFIAECEGDCSSAFHYYANTENSEKDTYLFKVLKGRNHLADYLRKLDLPLTLNKEISSILSEYSKTKISRREASVKLAAICEDEQTCLEAATNLFDSKDYISAIQLLNKGKISVENTMYIAINDMLEKSKAELLKSKVMQVIDLKRTSLLSNEDPTPFLNKIKRSCDEASMKSSIEWKDKANSYVGAIIKNHKDKEHQAYLDALEEEEARKRKRNKLIKYGLIGGSVLFVIMLASIGSSSDEKDISDDSINKEIIVSDNSNANTAEVIKSETRASKNPETTYSKESVKKYLEEILPKVINMNEEKAVKNYFSNEFISLYRKVEKYDKENVEEGCIGFWDFDFWTGGQDGELSGISVPKVSDFGNNKASVIVQYAIKFGEYDEGKSSCEYSMIFENGKWRIDDLNSYKFRFKEYLKSVGQ